MNKGGNFKTVSKIVGYVDYRTWKNQERAKILQFKNRLYCVLVACKSNHTFDRNTKLI